MNRIPALILFFFYAVLMRAQELPGSKSTYTAELQPADTMKALGLSDKAWGFIYEGRYDSALYYLNQSLDISKRLSFKRGILSYYYSRANIYWYQGDNPKALKLFELVLGQAKQLSSAHSLSKIYSGMALVYGDLGNLPKALEHHLLSLKYAEAGNNKIGIAAAYSNIGGIFSDQKDTGKAIVYYNKSIALLSELRDTMRLSAACNDLATVYNDMKCYAKARDYARQALYFATRSNYADVVASANTTLGGIHLNEHRLDSSMYYMKRAIRLREELQDMEGLIPCLLNVGNIYAKTNRPKEAILYLDQANRMAYAGHVMLYVSESESTLSDLYKELGDYKKAYEHHCRYMAARDSVFNEENTRKSVQAQMNYEFEKKQLQAEREQLKKDAAMEALRRRQQLVIWAVSGSLLLLSAIAFLAMRQFRSRNREREMRLEQKLLRSQMNPHFIFNSLQAIQNFIMRRNEKEAVKYLGSFASITRSVLENSRMELIPLRKEVSLLGNYLQLQKLRFADKFEYKVLADDAIIQDEIYIPPMLSQPFIENALEHGMSQIESGGLIEVRFSTEGAFLVLEIKDNGYGLNSGSKQEKEHISLATTITRERIELMNRKSRSKISFTLSEAYPGTERVGVKVRFLIPLSGILA